MRGKQVLKIILGLFALVVVAGIGFFAYVWFSGGTGEPSRDAQAMAVEPESAESVAYDVVRDESEARFVIDEVLRGQPNTVVGITNQIAGSVAIQENPGEVEIGEFVINVRTIRTDDEVRDRTIRTMILESSRDEFEFSSFRPTSIAGVPETIAPGDTLELAVSGDLTVRDVTTETTFDMSIRVDSADRISGLATTTVTWAELDITIPYVGGNSIVASVADSLDLELEFVARRRE